MWSETIGFRDYRPQYLRQFFRDVARQIPLNRKEDLLDLGCGAAEVALGFRRYVRSLTGVDSEQAMLDLARQRAAEAGCSIRLHCSLAQEAPEDFGKFHLITMGKAHWFMNSPATMQRIEQWLLPKGSVLVCWPSDANLAGAPWHPIFNNIRRRWARADNSDLLRLTPRNFFKGTDFEVAALVETPGTRTIDMDHVLKRALGYPSSSRPLLGDDADRMLEELRAALTPYFKDGPVTEQECSIGWIFRRRRDR